MSLFKGILECLTGSTDESDPAKYSNTTYKTAENEERLASDILRVLFTAVEPDKEMREQLDNVVHANNWTESLAKRILDNVVKALKSGAAMGSAMKKAYNKASEAAYDFAEKHPVFAAAILIIVAISVLEILAPWVVAALGFGELGPVAGSWAARWQSTFPDVEARSFFAFLQRLGMKWGKL